MIGGDSKSKEINESGISGASLAGMVIGIIFLVIISGAGISGGIYCCLKRSKRSVSKDSKSLTGSNTESQETLEMGTLPKKDSTKLFVKDFPSGLLF